MELPPERGTGAAADGGDVAGRSVAASSRSRIWPTRRRCPHTSRGARGPRSCRSVRPAITPRASGSKIGVRSPEKYGKTGRPRRRRRRGLGDQLSKRRTDSARAHVVTLPPPAMPARR